MLFYGFLQKLGETPDVKPIFFAETVYDTNRLPTPRAGI
ncbi:MAG: hypothetical protein JWP71_1434 [Mucilaginibacter sp.]|nr:hypothetical protein [Mucilaginibacter sp.]